jgi:cobalamin biosynthesis Mg chelatase CobN
MSSIQVTARGVDTVNDALEEVDAVVEALKDRADEVLRMLGKELDRDGDDDRGLTGPAIKAAAAGVATKATTSVAKSAVTKAARKAAKKAAKRARKSAKHAGKDAKDTRKKAAKAAKRAAKKAAVAIPVVDVAKSMAERAPELRGKRAKRAKRSSSKTWLIVGVAAVAIGGAMWWRMRAGRLRELKAVDNTPDEFGAVLEREQLAGHLAPR